MRMMILTAALALGACAQQQAAGPTGPAAVTTARPLPGAPVASGEARIPVTARVAGSVPSQTVPAECTAEGTGFRAAFVAPTVLAVPTFGPGTGGVRVACEANGLAGAARAEPSVARGQGAYGGLPAIGVGIGTGYGGGASVSVGGFFGGGGGWAGGQQPAVIRYPAVEVVLSRGTAVE